MFNNFKFLIFNLSNKRKRQGLLLLFLMILTAILEIVSIGAIIPFISALTQPQSVMEVPLVEEINIYFGIDSTSEFAFFMTVIFCSVSIFASLIKLFYQWVQLKFSTAISTDLGKLCFRNILSLSFYRDYGANSGDLISTIFVKINLVLVQVIIPFFSIIASFILIIGIFFGLLIINFKVTLILFGSFLASYLLSLQVLKKRMYSHGDSVNENQNIVIKNLQNVFGSIKEIILGNMQKFYINIFEDSDFKLKTSQAKIAFYKVAPRYLVELTMLSIFAILTYQILSIDDETKFDNLALLSALALTAVKIFPIVQNIFSNWFSIQSHQKVFEDVLSRIKSDNQDGYVRSIETEYNFKTSIVLSNVSFSHSSSQESLLKDVNLRISKGQKVLITGPTGSGKSTLIDLIMGLLTPISGFIKIDEDRLNNENISNWQALIGHVPQSIYMFNKSVNENIAIAEDPKSSSQDRIKVTAKLAMIHDQIIEWESGYNTVIGEGGKKISGGEAQRIGIARALYKSPEVLVFDEATNSLDVKTEQALFKNLFSQMGDKTIILISHQLDHDEFFDLVLQVNNGEVKVINNKK